MELDLELEWELEWELELKWGVEVGAGMGAVVGVGVEATESSGIPAGGPKIRTLGPNGTFEHFRN